MQNVLDLTCIVTLGSKALLTIPPSPSYPWMKTFWGNTILRQGKQESLFSIDNTTFHGKPLNRWALDSALLELHRTARANWWESKFLFKVMLCQGNV